MCFLLTLNSLLLSQMVQSATIHLLVLCNKHCLLLWQPRFPLMVKCRVLKHLLKLIASLNVHPDKSLSTGAKGILVVECFSYHIFLAQICPAALRTTFVFKELPE